MSVYRLIKDVVMPNGIIPAGTEFKDDGQDGYLFNHEISRAFDREGINDFNQWFEEVPEPRKRWRAQEGRKYYYLNHFGGVDGRYEGLAPEDDFKYSIGNYFKTIEQAGAYRDYLAALQTIKDDAKGFEPDWDDHYQEKWYGYYYRDNDKLRAISNKSYQNQGSIYFALKEDIEASFKKHRKEWLTVLGVEK